eukprot:scaffold90_cov163-Ochromonas_danica.AAC.6
MTTYRISATHDLPALHDLDILIKCACWVSFNHAHPMDNNGQQWKQVALPPPSTVIILTSYEGGLLFNAVSFPQQY